MMSVSVWMLPACLVLIPGHAAAQSDSRAVDAVEALVARYDSSWNSRDTVGVERLLAPDRHDAPRPGPAEVPGEPRGRRMSLHRGRGADVQCRRERPGKGFDLAGPQRDPRVRAGADEARRALDRDEARGRPIRGPAARLVIVCEADVTGFGREQVAPEGDDHVGLREIVDEIERATERLHGSGAPVRVGHGGMAVPARVRVDSTCGAHEALDRGGGERRKEHVQPTPILRRKLAAELANEAFELRPGATGAVLRRRSRSVGVVQRQHLGLGEDVGGAEAFLRS